MAQVQITDLPNALPLTGSESVPIVQNGVTVQTTTGAISGAGALNYPFLTVGSTAGLTEARQISTGSGLSLTDNGAGYTLQINLTGAAQSLDSSGVGLQVKTGPNTLTGRTFEVGTGLGITNPDGVAGNPQISLGSALAHYVSLTGTGILAIQSGTVGKIEIDGVSNQTTVTNGNGSGNVLIGLSNNPVLPGNGGVTIPVGSTAQRTSAANGVIRYNTDLLTYEGYSDGAWKPFSLAGGITQIDTGLGLLGGPITSFGTISIDETVVATTGNALTLTNKTISGSSNTLTNIGNSSLVNSSFTINGTTISLGGTGTITAAAPNALTIGTGLNGISYNGSAPVTIALANTAVTAGTYGSSNYAVTFTVDQQGRLTSAGETEITPSGIGAISQVDGTADQITSSQVGSVVTLAIADSPALVGPIKVSGTGVTSITPFAQTMGVFEANDNSYQEVYARNLNNGSDASADFIAYNDASDLDSYFIDMGMNSSNFTSVSYPIFTPNSGYLFTGGGLSGQQSDLFIGTSNPASDIIFFVGGVDTANQCGMINGTTGNFLIGTDTDTGYKLNVAGTTYFGGASTFGGTVLLNANPTLALQAATKQYVDSAASSGLYIHTPVYVEQGSNLNATYNNGSAGVGATLTNAGTQVALTIDGVLMTTGKRVLVYGQTNAAQNGVYTVTTVGDGSTNWVLTRATDADTYAANSTTALGKGSYFYVTNGLTGAGESYVLTTEGVITFGTTDLTFTQFSGAVTYTGGTNISIVGQTISLTGTVAATNGGTGTNTVAVGDLLYGSATDTWSKLPLGSAYKSLTVNASGTQLEWNAVALNQASAVSGQLGVSNGGTSFASYTTGDMIYASGSAALSKLALGTSGYVLTAGASAPQYVAQSTLAVGSATNATNTGITADSTNATNYLTFVSNTSGNLPQLVNSSITCNPSTGAITGGIFGGSF